MAKIKKKNGNPRWNDRFFIIRANVNAGVGLYFFSSGSMASA
jgi:Ca2+-dependent lipid-binding protein